MNFHIITLFPEMFGSYLNESIVARAQKEKKISVKFYNPRDFVKPTKSQKKNAEPYLRVDDKPYGGGPGMVMQAEPVIKAIEKALKAYKLTTKSQKQKARILWLTPSGSQFTNTQARKWAKEISDIIIIAGRYEGIDARVKQIFNAEEITVGPFVLTGGELPAMIIIDAVARQIEGVLGNVDSREEERVASANVYTRPETIVYKKKKYNVPKVLLSGNHKLIEDWRKNGGEQK